MGSKNLEVNESKLFHFSQISRLQPLSQRADPLYHEMNHSLRVRR